MFKSVWRIESTLMLARIVLLLAAAAFVGLRAYLPSPVVWTVAGIAVSILIYRLRYKRF